MDSMKLWASLGIDGAHVEIVEHCAEWAVIFERERAAILERCWPWVAEVHHVGSTSVHGLAAKPILDIMPVAANHGDAEKAIEPMTSLGYQYRGENGVAGRFYYNKFVDGRTVAHVHMYPQGHSDARKMAVFRDRLRTHRETACAYERLKRKQALEHRNDGGAYTDAKSAFIRSVTELAMSDLTDGSEEVL